jgi:hypothetical protein
VTGHKNTNYFEVSYYRSINKAKYLQPRFQKIMFFPELWSDEEKAQWGSAAFKRN